jgi:hypothetical protein
MLSNSGWQLADTKGKLKVSVSSSQRWAAASDSSWLKVKSSSGRSGQSFTIVADKNKDGDRVGHITVRSGSASSTLTIHQSGASTISLNATPNLWQPGPATSTQTFTVTTNSTIPWTAKAKARWLHVVQQNGNQLTLSVDPNPTNSPRRSKVVIQLGSRQFTIHVTQARGL